MAQRIMRLQLSQAGSLTFVDPTDFRSTFRITQKVNTKAAGSVTVYNSRSEIITNTSPLVVIAGCTDACSVNRENVSIRTTISGSVENKATVAQALADHLINLGLAKEDLISGLLPPQTTNFVVDSGTGT